MYAKKILVLGASSFAAQGLVERLMNDGHVVSTFHRGAVGRIGSRISGSVQNLCSNPELAEPFDVVVNYVVLKGKTWEENRRFIDELLRFCTVCEAGHLIHISSVSAYDTLVHDVVEDADVEQNPRKKGSYGSLKVVQDLRLLQRRNRGLRVSYVRPGFILGRGLENPTVGMAIHLGGGLVLQLGSGKSVVPVTTRKLVNDVVARLVGLESTDEDLVVLVVDAASPSRREWVAECCKCTGIGKRIIELPTWTWRCAGLVAGVAALLLRKNIRPMNVVANMCRELSYNASKSEALLKLDFKINWPDELRNALENNEGRA